MESASSGMDEVSKLLEELKKNAPEKKEMSKCKYGKCDGSGWILGISRFDGASNSATVACECQKELMVIREYAQIGLEKHEVDHYGGLRKIAPPPEPERHTGYQNSIKMAQDYIQHFQPGVTPAWAISSQADDATMHLAIAILMEIKKKGFKVYRFKIFDFCKKYFESSGEDGERFTEYAFVHEFMDKINIDFAMVDDIKHTAVSSSKSRITECVFKELFQRRIPSVIVASYSNFDEFKRGLGVLKDGEDPLVSGNSISLVNNMRKGYYEIHL